MQWISAVSDAKNWERAVNEAIAAVQGGLADARPDLTLLFVSPHHAESCELVMEQVRAVFPGSLLFGCTGQHVIGAGRELEGQPGLSLVAAVLPSVTLNGFHLGPDAIPDPSVGPEPWHRKLGLTGDDRPHFVLLPDPFSCDSETLVLSLDASFPRSVKIGGLASAGDEPGGNLLFLGSEVHQSGVVGIALHGNIEVDTIVAQGCRPIGHPMFVTRSRQNLLFELDGKPPADLLQAVYDQAKPGDRELFRTSLFLGIEMREELAEYHQGDFLIRNLMGFDPDSGALGVATPLYDGQVVQFHLRDAETSARDLEEQLSRYRSRESRQENAGGALLFSCLGRGQQLYGAPNHDSDSFRRQLGEIPLAGFFCNGEIGPVQGQTFLHGYTSAFGIFRPSGR